MISDIKNEIVNIIDSKNECNISLREYLIRILHISKDYSTNTRISSSKFIDILNKAFTIILNTHSNYEQQYKLKPPIINLQDSNFEVLRETILFQINELDCMEKDESLLRNKMSYFGVDSPNGNRWYNFDPLTYLECASSWLVDYYGEDMHMNFINWGLFARFLEMGRLYE